MSVPVTDAEHETFVDPPSRWRRWRLVLLGVLFVGSLVTVKLTGLDEYFDIARVRAFMESAGPLGFVAFVGLFAIGQLLHVPGLVFVGAASIAYGQLLGIPTAYVGAVFAVTFSFVVVRTVGGQPLGEVKRPIVRRILARLESHPIATIAILRLIFWTPPALNYACAMSPMRLRDFVIGSALGLAPPIVVAVIFFDWVADTFL